LALDSVSVLVSVSKPTIAGHHLPAPRKTWSVREWMAGLQKDKRKAEQN
jgi:hypothetical protein